MFYKRLFVSLLIVVITLAALPRIPAEAQTTELPLLKMLSFVPNAPFSHEGEIYFNDLDALISAHPGAVRPKSRAEFESLQNTNKEGVALYEAARNGATFDSPTLAPSFSFMDNIINTVGIDLFTVSSTLEFSYSVHIGDKLRDITLLFGQFDPAAIEGAYTKRQFTKGDLEGLTLFCGPEGCDKGYIMDSKNREPSDPFGGNLGRKQPIVVTKEFVFSSPVIEVVEDMANTYLGKSPSLAQAPEYAAIADTLYQIGPVLQAIYVWPQIPVDNAEGLKLGSPTSIAPYSLAALAHLADKQNQYAVVSLVYDKETDAQQAGGVIMTRIEQYQPRFVRGQSLAQALKAHGGSLEAPRVVQSNGKAVLLIVIRVASEPHAKDEKLGRYVPSYWLYRVLVNSLSEGKLGWLAPEIK